VSVSEDVLGSTWCVVPMWNESSVIADVVRELKTVFTNILCIDDGSSDRSTELALEAGANVLVLPINVGQGGALSAGFSLISLIPKARYIITFDADGQHDPNDALTLVSHLVEKKLDIVFATRFSHKNKSNVPWVKRCLLRSVARINSISKGSKLTDSHNGLRALTVGTATKFKLSQNGMAHASEIVSIATRYKLNYEELAVTIRYTTYSKSKGQSLLNGVNILSDLIWR
jgi:glycosyltransferase involved in cell wall biosynthesis